MANATATIQEISFDVRDEQMTHVYVLVRAGGDAENALLRMGIAGITARGGGWAESRIKEAIGDE